MSDPPEASADPSPLLTPREAADLLKVCRRTMLRLVDRGVIIPVKLGKRNWRYRKSDVEKLAE